MNAILHFSKIAFLHGCFTPSKSSLKYINILILIRIGLIIYVQLGEGHKASPVFIHPFSNSLLSFPYVPELVIGLSNVVEALIGAEDAYRFKNK